jgi:hypothetical protein
MEEKIKAEETKSVINVNAFFEPREFQLMLYIRILFLRYYDKGPLLRS